MMCAIMSKKKESMLGSVWQSNIHVTCKRHSYDAAIATDRETEEAVLSSARSFQSKLHSSFSSIDSRNARASMWGVSLQRDQAKPILGVPKTILEGKSP